MKITNDQFEEAYAKLPFPIRQYLADDDLGEVVQEVGQKHGLHVDTIGALEREVNNMLLGFTNPAQFVGELKSIGIPEGNLGPIVQELNDRIFIPLQEKMKRVGTEDPRASDEKDMAELAEELEISSPVPEVGFVQASSPVPAPNFAQVPSYATSTSPVSQFAPQSFTPPTPVVPVTPVVLPVSVPIAPTPTPVPVPMMPSVPVPPVASAPVTPHEFIRTMNQDMQAVQEHQAPAMQPYKEIPMPAMPPARPTPLPMAVAPVAPPMPAPVSAPVPMSVPAPAPMPAPRSPVNRMPAPQQPVVQPSVQPATPPANNKEALHQVLKEYGIDPYREPVEE